MPNARPWKKTLTQGCDLLLGQAVSEKVAGITFRRWTSREKTNLCWATLFPGEFSVKKNGRLASLPVWVRVREVESPQEADKRGKKGKEEAG